MPEPWETAISADSHQYRLALIPLWAVEGGIVAIEVLVADRQTPESNLLGERQNDSEQPFVVTVHELEHGIAKSRFGRLRQLNAGPLAVELDVLDSRLGHGVGDCGDCPNIQELSIAITIKSKQRLGARFYKAECGTAADYLELAKDGTYRVMAREHVGVLLTEEGRWQQNGALITFTPHTRMQGGKRTNAEGRAYDGTEVEYKGKTFISWNSEGAAGIIVPIERTKQELELDPKSIPLYVFFKTTPVIFARETKQPYPFRYINPAKTR